VAELLLPLVIVSLLGALLALDQTAWGQFLVSRPLPAALLTGAALGVPQEGGMLGLLLELLWVRALPMGSHVPYLPLYPAVLAVLLVAVPPGHSLGWQALPLAPLLALPAAAVNHRVDVLWRRTNDFLGEAAASFAAAGRMRGARALHLVSLLRLFAMHGTALVFCGLLLVALQSLALAYLPVVVDAAALLWPVPFLVGLAGIWPRRKGLPLWTWAAAAAAFLAGALAGWKGIA
jgi:mannose/fructose/N-acetylgalactosamine-specific phosphotransferase system component IIC